MNHAGLMTSAVDPPNQEPRKRHSSTSVCNFCRRRKVRCDRGQPCSACVKYGNQVCEYSSSYVSSAERKSERNGYGESILRLDLNGSSKYNGSPAHASKFSPPDGPYRSRQQSYPVAPHHQSHQSHSHQNHSHQNHPHAQHAPQPGFQQNPSPMSNSSNSNSISSILNSSNGSQAAYPSSEAPSSVYQELEMLKLKLSMLEQSVSNNPSKSPNNNSELPVWMSPTGNPADTSFVVGKNPYLSPTQTYSFHGTYVPLMCFGLSNYRHHDPLSWFTMINIDAAARTMIDYRLRHAKKNLMLSSLKTLPNEPSERIFGDKLRELCEDESEEALPAHLKPSLDPKTQELLRKINERARGVGLTVYEGSLERMSTVEKALALLPTKDVIWLLIDRFFKTVYPFFPYLDQNQFEAKVVKLFGGSDRDRVKLEKLHISHKSQLSVLGLLLLVIRFAYLALFTLSDSLNEEYLVSEDPDPKSQERKYLMQNPIDTNVYDVAQECCDQFAPAASLTLESLQLCLYLRAYQANAPENSEGAADLNSTGVMPKLIDMAMSLGLHREPSNIGPHLRSEATNNLGRKIWWHLIIVDCVIAITNGCHVHIHRAQFDTRPPFYIPGNENIRDIELEQEVNIIMQRFDTAYDGLYTMVSSIADVRTPLNMKEFCDRLSQTEIGYSDQSNTGPIGMLSFVGKSPTGLDVKSTVDLKIGITISFFTASICLHFFNHYENIRELDLAYFYLKKVICLGVKNLMPFYDHYLKNGPTLLGDIGDFYVTPSFLTLVHKVSVTIHCILLRGKFSTNKCEMSTTHMSDMASDARYKRRYDLLTELDDLGEQCLQIFYSTMKKLGNRYYYAWRYTKAQEKLVIIRTNKDYFTKWCKGKEAYMQLTDPMLEDLNQLFRQAFSNQGSRPTIDPDEKVLTDFKDGEKLDPVMPDLTRQQPTDDFSSDEMWMSMMTMVTGAGKPTNMNDMDTMFSTFTEGDMPTGFPDGYLGDFFNAPQQVVFDDL